MRVVSSIKQRSLKTSELVGFSIGQTAKRLYLIVRTSCATVIWAPDAVKTASPELIM